MLSYNIVWTQSVQGLNHPFVKLWHSLNSVGPAFIVHPLLFNYDVYWISHFRVYI